MLNTDLGASPPPPHPHAHTPRADVSHACTPHMPCHGLSWMDRSCMCKRPREVWVTTTGLEKEGLPDATGQRGARMQTGPLLLQPPCSSGQWNVLKLSFLPHSANLQSFFIFPGWRFTYRHSNFKSSPCAELTLIFSRSLFLPISITLYNLWQINRSSCCTVYSTHGIILLSKCYFN